MTFESLSVPLLLVIGASWIVSIYCLFRLWRSREYFLLKVLYSVVLPVPVFGPFIFFWSSNMPPSMHPDLMDQNGRQLDVLNRWRARLEASGKLHPLERFESNRRNSRRRGNG
jgi:hypothetical protein